MFLVHIVDNSTDRNAKAAIGSGWKWHGQTESDIEIKNTPIAKRTGVKKLRLDLATNRQRICHERLEDESVIQCQRRRIGSTRISNDTIEQKRAVRR